MKGYLMRTLALLILTALALGAADDQAPKVSAEDSAAILAKIKAEKAAKAAPKQEAAGADTSKEVAAPTPIEALRALLVQVRKDEADLDAQQSKLTARRVELSREFALAAVRWGNSNPISPVSVTLPDDPRESQIRIRDAAKQYNDAVNEFNKFLEAIKKARSAKDFKGDSVWLDGSNAVRSRCERILVTTDALGAGK